MKTRIDKKHNQTSSGNLKIKKTVFFIPWFFLFFVVIISFFDNEYFVKNLTIATDFILDNFAWLFNFTTLACLFTVILIYFSPLANVRIGGKNAKPILSYANLIWVTLCTTIAAGILFWASAEPLYHFNSPASFEGVKSRTPEAAVFAMKTMFLEWTWSPYAIYTTATILFAFVFYNMKKPFSVGSALTPVFGNKVKKYNNFIDIVCLFSLVAGMAASLGIGTLILAGGLHTMFGIPNNSFTWILIITVIVITFIISSISGIVKGIRILSSINAKVYMLLLVFVMLFGPTTFMLNFSIESWGSYVSDFFKMSLATGEIYNNKWSKEWPIFYWCNWLAWTPITAIFLAKILRGHTIKEAIQCNFIIPSIFSTIWMAIFSSSALFFDMQNGALTKVLTEKGPGFVVYSIFEKLPLKNLLIPFYLFIVFISFVTASDSNTNAMGGLCTYNDDCKEDDSPAWLKIVWGITIGVVTWILISSAGIDGVKKASNLGGFPNMFLMLAFIVCLIKVCKNPSAYDKNKSDYDSNGKFMDR